MHSIMRSTTKDEQDTIDTRFFKLQSNKSYLGGGRMVNQKHHPLCYPDFHVADGVTNGFVAPL